MTVLPSPDVGVAETHASRRRCWRCRDIWSYRGMDAGRWAGPRRCQIPDLASALVTGTGQGPGRPDAATDATPLSEGACGPVVPTQRPVPAAELLDAVADELLPAGLWPESAATAAGERVADRVPLAADPAGLRRQPAGLAALVRRARPRPAAGEASTGRSLPGRPARGRCRTRVGWPAPLGAVVVLPLPARAGRPRHQPDQPATDRVKGALRWTTRAPRPVGVDVAILRRWDVR